jgi:F-type H+-transporting ATPase subunit delta
MSQDSQARQARLVAQLDANVGMQHLGSVYADALLRAAENAGQTEAILAELDDFVREVLNVVPDFERILSSQLVSHEEKVGLLDRTIGSRASPMLLNFLKVVSRHGRLDILRAIRRQAHELYDKLRGNKRVRLSTATPIDDALAQQIAASLSGIVGGQPILERVVDPELIGGIVVRVGDTVYDASIANQLQTLRQQMIHRSAHEIQSRRDRFRSPARD